LKLKNATFLKVRDNDFSLNEYFIAYCTSNILHKPRNYKLKFAKSPKQFPTLQNFFMHLTSEPQFSCNYAVKAVNKILQTFYLFFFSAESTTSIVD